MFHTRFKLSESEFFKNISYQMFGTGLAQLLPFAATPILTRFYSEQDFASYTSFYAIAGILAVGAGGRYQYAIVLPQKDTEATEIFTLSVYITIAYAVMLSLASFIFIHFSTNSLLNSSVVFAPAYVLGFGIWTSLSNLSVRQKTFFRNAIAKVLQSICYVVPALVLGVFSLSTYGLTLSRIAGAFASCLYMFKGMGLKIKRVPLHHLKEVAVRYKSYPKYGLIPAFLDIASVQGLVLILAKFYPTQDLGYFGLTSLVLNAPISLIGGSFKDVFYQKMASLINNEPQKAISFFNKSALGLFIIGLPICIIIYFWGDSLFALVFGEKWQRSGEFASLISFSFLTQLVVSPLSSIFNAANKLKIASLWQTLYFISTFTTLGASAYIFKLPVDTLLIVYVIHEVILYSLYFALQVWTLKNMEHVRHLRNNREE